jgi:hypothetical protein
MIAIALAASRHLKKRYRTRIKHEGAIRRIVEKHGKMLLSEIRAKHIIIWHDEWSQGGQTIDMAHQMVGHLRTIFGCGAVVLENQDCERLLVVMRDKRLSFPMGEPREEIITAEQATAIRTKARQLGHFSIALVQALQFDLMLRQKDCPMDPDVGAWRQRWKDWATCANISARCQ